MASLIDTIKSTVPENVKMTLLLRGFGFLKAPLILFCQPEVLDISERDCRIQIPLKRRTKNHLGSLYFGALCIGADLAGGLLAVKKMRDSGFNGQFAFKDFSTEFLKRAEGNTIFVCEDGALIDELIDELKANGGRADRTLRVNAFVPDKLGSEPVMKSQITISIKSLRQ